MSNGQWQKKTNRKFQDSFLEALRDLGTSHTPDLPDFYPSPASPKPTPLSGIIHAGETVALSDNPEAQKYKQLFFQERSLRKDEKTLAVRQDQEVKLKVQELREELIKFSSKHIELEQQIKITVLQPLTPQVGSYHITFLERLISLVSLLRKNVESASNWLALFNGRKKKKGYYWGNVKKSGSKFYLSPDRYSSTQAG